MENLKTLLDSRWAYVSQQGAFLTQSVAFRLSPSIAIPSPVGRPYTGPFSWCNPTVVRGACQLFLQPALVRRLTLGESRLGAAVR